MINKLRILQNRDNRSQTGHCYKLYDILPIHDLYELQNATLVYTVLYHPYDVPTVFHSFNTS